MTAGQMFTTQPTFLRNFAKLETTEPSVMTMKMYKIIIVSLENEL